MSVLIKLIGLALIIGGIYLLGQNIYFVSDAYPYWWRGVAADGSIEGKALGAIAIAVGILLVFVSSRVVLRPTTLWHFVGSLACLVAGYQLITTGRLHL